MRALHNQVKTVGPFHFYLHCNCSAVPALRRKTEVPR